MQHDDTTAILVAIARLETRMSNVETAVGGLAKRVEAGYGEGAARLWQVLVAVTSFLATAGWGLLLYTVTRGGRP